MKAMETAIQLGEKIAAGVLDPVELAESVFEKIDNSGIAENVFPVLTRERAMAEAGAARERQKSGSLLGPLDGVPVTWKDLFDTAGIATEAGSGLLKGRIPHADAEVVKRGTGAGLVCIGKTHLSELAFSGLGINPNAATSPNIHGPELAPGGSSSGAAASVAFGFVPIGFGSDTGGSVRIPSAWNDLVGLKTTAGLIPNDGVVPLCPRFDTAGPLCTTVGDACLSMQILAGQKTGLPEAKPLSSCRFLLNRTITLDDVAEDQMTGFQSAVEALGRAGAEIIEGEIGSFNEMQPLGPVLFPFEAWQAWGGIIDKNPDVMFEPIRNRFASGRDILSVQYQQAWDRMLELRSAYLNEVDGFDAVLAPTVAIPPPNVEQLLGDLDLFQQTNLIALRNTRIGNMFGLCALTLPTSRPASGIMFYGNPLQEQRLLSIGLSAESVVRECR